MTTMQRTDKEVSCSSTHSMEPYVSSPTESTASSVRSHVSNTSSLYPDISQHTLDMDYDDGDVLADLGVPALVPKETSKPSRPPPPRRNTIGTVESVTKPYQLVRLILFVLKTLFY